MGSPEFALPTLKKLIDSEHEVICVYTQVPKPAGRGHKLRKSPIHEYAEANNILVRYPKSLKDINEQKLFDELKADIGVTAAYGLLLPKEVLESPKMGCINIHPSLLSRWRGAAPIQQAIIAGDIETGVCIMQMDEGLDTGDILLKENIQFDDNYNAELLHDELSELGAEMILLTLDGLENKTIIPQKQSDEGVTYAKKITKDECKIDWNKPVKDINNMIRGLSPYPAAYFIYKNEKIKILEAEIYKGNFDYPAGKVIDNFLTVMCGKGALSPTKVQRSGKKSMSTQDMLRGFPIPDGTILE